MLINAVYCMKKKFIQLTIYTLTIIYSSLFMSAHACSLRQVVKPKALTSVLMQLMPKEELSNVVEKSTFVSALKLPRAYLDKATTNNDQSDVLNYEKKSDLFLLIKENLKISEPENKTNIWEFTQKKEEVLENFWGFLPGC